MAAKSKTDTEVSTIYEDEKKDNTSDSKSQPVNTTLTQEAVYSINDLAASAKKLFGTTSEVVITAMKLAGKTCATESDAKKIVKDFMNMEV